MKIAPRVPTALRALSPSTAAVRVRPTGSDDRVVASETSWAKQTLLNPTTAEFLWKNLTCSDELPSLNYCAAR